MASASREMDATQFEGLSSFTNDTHAEFGREMDEIRLLCIGKTGAGKSSVGNTIIGKKIFNTRASSRSVTDKCKFESSIYAQNKIVFIDTPGLFDTKVDNTHRLEEIGRCVSLASPGFHAVLMTCRIERFTQEEQKVVELFRNVFGPKLMDYMIIIFTYKDNIDDEGTDIEDYVKDSDDEMKSLLIECKHRYLAVNNKGSEEDKESFRNTLIQMVNTTIERNDGKYFTSDQFVVTEAIIQKRKEELETTHRDKLAELESKQKHFIEEIQRLKNNLELLEKPDKDQTKDITEVRQKYQNVVNELKKIGEDIEKEKSNDLMNELRNEVCAEERPIWFRVVLWVLFEMAGSLDGRSPLTGPFQTELKAQSRDFRTNPFNHIWESKDRSSAWEYAAVARKSQLTKFPAFNLRNSFTTSGVSVDVNQAGNTMAKSNIKSTGGNHGTFNKYFRDQMKFD